MELFTLVWDGIYMVRTIFIKDSRQDLYIVGLVSLVVGQIISIILLTADRVLVVKLAINYRGFITKRKILISLSLCWIICFLHGFITYFFLISVYS